ncbi:DNA-binding protein [Oscillatoria sp. FACHB-1407]|nr:DNA-binding protein [Oscillatoria sp. FACHB-1407]
MDVFNFRQKLIEWGQEHFRPFPWRFTDDPYYILMAEVMLHRTQAQQVVPVYKHFIKRFPDIASLGEATEEEVGEMLYSLGLHWRTRLIHEMAIALVSRFDGKIPSKKSDLHSLPGVSDYIVSAVRCFAWKLPDAIVDTNTVRVTGRLFGLEVKDSSRRNRKFRELIASLIDPEKPVNYNYALLDLAAQICTKSRPPNCGQCPVQSVRRQ